MNHATDKVLWLEMLPDELLEAIESRGVCYMGYGLAEPHGPYQALGLDWIKAHAILERAAREYGAVVAPALAWHIHERPSFPWLEKNGVKDGGLCSSIPAELFYKLVMYQLRAFDARRFRAAVLVTGHYGGIERDLRLVCEYYQRRTGTPMRIAAFADWELITLDGVRGDHAGVTETSQLMAARPDLVDLSREVNGWPTGGWCGRQFDETAMPSEEHGQRIITSQTAKLGEVSRELLADYQPVAGYAAPTLTDVEAMWTRFEQVSRKYWVCSTTLAEYGQGPPTFPGWDALGE